MNQHTDLPLLPVTPGLPRWQFGLRHLFVVMTWCAVAACLVRLAGPGTLVMSGGLLVGLLNCCGAFGKWQVGRTQAALAWAAWRLFLISLWLPSLPAIFGTGSIPGYTAAWYSLTAPYHAFVRQDFWQPAIFWLSLMNVANLLMAALPATQRGRTSAWGQGLIAALGITMVSAWSVTWEGRMRVGYFVWCGSFCLALVAFPIRWWTWGAMAALGAILALLLQWDRIML